jgi:amino acid adenylation domain-containing protein
MLDTPRESFLLWHGLTRSARQWPERTALMLGEQTVSYRELDSATNRLAHALRAQGLRRGDRVGILLSKSVTAVTAVLGILKAGCAYVPIDVSVPAKRFEYIVGNCGITLLITASDALARFGLHSGCLPSVRAILLADGTPPRESAGEPKTVVGWEAVTQSDGASCPATGAIERDLAYVLYTSGSTGDPKGVMFTHRNSLGFVHAARDFFRIDEKDRLASHAPLHFDLSIFDLFVAFEAGARVVLVPEATTLFPASVARCIQDARISVWNSVPSVLVQLATRTTPDDYDLSSLRLVLFSGEVFPARHLRALKGHLPHADFFNLYGQTEANTSMYYHVTTMPVDDAWRAPIGRPLPNFDVYALDDHGRRIERPGEEGELYVRGATVAQGYWGDRERTERSFVDNIFQEHFPEKVYRTGDLVALNPEGEFVFRGRRDQLIKSRGYRIELDEIESVLRSHPDICECAVVPVPDEQIGNRILAFVVPASSTKIDVRSVQGYLGERLPRYMLPESIELRESLPLTSTAKVDKRRLIASVI